MVTKTFVFEINRGKKGHKGNRCHLKSNGDTKNVTLVLESLFVSALWVGKISSKALQVHKNLNQLL